MRVPFGQVYKFMYLLGLFSSFYFLFLAPRVLILYTLRSGLYILVVHFFSFFSLGFVVCCTCNDFFQIGN